MADVRRGEVWWANLPEPRGSEPGFRRPVVIVQADSFNRSRISTVLAVSVSSNMDLRGMRGNVVLLPDDSGLDKHSVVNMTQVLTLDRRYLSECVAELPPAVMTRIDDGLRLVMDL